MAGIHITDIEAAINYWREQKPSPDGVTLAPEIRALAEVYALMIYYHHEEAAEKGFPKKESLHHFFHFRTVWSLFEQISFLTIQIFFPYSKAL